jgi:hypothetical protein
MAQRPHDDEPRPLPREWLPEATAPEGAPEWEARLERITALAEPALRRLAGPWSSLLGVWWKPAAALVAAAALALALSPDGQDASLPLSVIARDGGPLVLWERVGIEADPVLALIALAQSEDR